MRELRRNVFCAAAAALLAHAVPAAAQQVPLPGAAIPQFVDPLPSIAVVDARAPSASGPREIRMCEFDANVLSTGTLLPAAKPTTRVWGYVAGSTCPAPGDAPRDTYVGPVIVAQRGVPAEFRWVNALGTTASTRVVAWTSSTDQTLHWADPLATGGSRNFCSHMLMSPMPGDPCWNNYAGPIPAVVHLHGGEVPSVLDGGPDAWFTMDATVRGHAYYTRPGAGAGANEAIYRYPNVQQAAPLWFHDHTLGATRLNVYAGLAGGYLLTDPGASAASLPGPAETIPLVIQDRQFDTNGQLLFQAGANGGILWALNPEHPYWSPEFVGDAIVVNGKTWPFLNVEPRRYRLLFLNGSNARTYELFLVDPVTKQTGPPLWVIGSDGGLLDLPAKVDPSAGGKLLLVPGERYEVIVDFGALPAGTTLVLKNTAKTPYPGGETPNGNTLGRILQVRVVPCASNRCGANDTSFDPAGNTALRRTPIERLGAFTARRQLTLNEVEAVPPSGSIDPRTGLAYPGGPLEILLNNTKWSGETARRSGDFTPVTVNGVTTLVTERPEEGATELWELVNTTADAHPIHLHLVQFQILNRQAYNPGNFGKAYAAAFAAAPGCGLSFCPGFGPPNRYDVPNAAGALGGNPDVTPFLSGPARAPAAYESGWKDTVMAPPGAVTRILVRWAPQDASAARTPWFAFDPNDGNGYVWHCHIIDHEDNEMMRQTFVVPNPSAPSPRAYAKGVDY